MMSSEEQVVEKNGSYSSSQINMENGVFQENVAGENFGKRPLMLLGLVFFSTYASIGVYGSFISLFLKEIGLTPIMIGFVLCCRPLGGLFAGVLSPMLVGTFPSERIALVFSSMLFLVTVFSIGFVPSMKTYMECCLTDFSAIGDSFYSSAGQIIPNASLLERSQYVNNERFTLVSNSSNISLAPNTTNTTTFQLDGLKKPRARDFINSTSVFHIKENNPDERFSRNIFKLDHPIIITTLLLGLLVLTGEFEFVTVDTVSHGITMVTLGKGNSQSYGLIRAWGTIGHGAGAIVTGAIVTLTVHETFVCGRRESQAEYRYMFYVFLAFAFLICVTVGGIGKTKSISTVDDVRKVSISEFYEALGTPRNVSWLVVIVARSMFYAVTQGFLYWHMENIGGSPILIGFANCITTTTEFLMFFMTPKLIERFGQMKIVTVGIFSYVVRFIIFSYIQNPYYILPVEILEGVMYACIWSSLISHLSNQVSQSHQTQISGLVQSLYMIGTGLGFVMSGALTQAFGTPTMFLVFSGIASVTLVFFVGVHKLF